VKAYVKLGFVLWGRLFPNFKL